MSKGPIIIDIQQYLFDFHLDKTSIIILGVKIIKPREVNQLALTQLASIPFNHGCYNDAARLVRKIYPSIGT